MSQQWTCGLFVERIGNEVVLSWAAGGKTFGVRMDAEEARSLAVRLMNRADTIDRPRGAPGGEPSIWRTEEE